MTQILSLLLAAGVSMGADSAFLSLPNVVFESPGKVESPDELYFVAEIAEGSTGKFELRTATGQLFLDRVLCPRKVLGTDREVHAFPLSYGITPARFNVDGDPLDLIVAGSGDFYRQQAKSGKPKPRKVRVIGLLKMEECEDPACKEKDWIQDYKILAVDLEDSNYKKVKTPQDLPAGDLKKYEEFFGNYKGNKGGNSYTRVTGTDGPEKAFAMIKREFPEADRKKRDAEIEKCRKIYESAFKKFSSHKGSIQKDDVYLTCLQRVHYEGFLPGHSSFDFFLSYNAAQRALELGEKDVTLENAISLHEARKAAKKTYYRFAGLDMPAPPGTGNPLYEWIKSKSRNEGCPEGFQSQHYETRKLLDY